jgi:hypothetical protein
MKHPVELIFNVTVKLGAYQPLFRGKHIVHIRAAGAGGVKIPFAGFVHVVRIP